MNLFSAVKIAKLSQILSFQKDNFCVYIGGGQIQKTNFCESEDNLLSSVKVGETFGVPISKSERAINVELEEKALTGAVLCLIADAYDLR